jgi:hypothetical protein
MFIFEHVMPSEGIVVSAVLLNALCGPELPFWLMRGNCYAACLKAKPPHPSLCPQVRLPLSKTSTSTCCRRYEDYPIEMMFPSRRLRFAIGVRTAFLLCLIP